MTKLVVFGRNIHACMYHTTVSNFRDILLLETGFLAVVVAPLGLFRMPKSHYHDKVTMWLVKWLLFRLMFASGTVKLKSGCETWWGLTALDWHFESQVLLACWPHTNWTYGSLYSTSVMDIVLKFFAPFLEFVVTFSFISVYPHPSGMVLPPPAPVVQNDVQLCRFHQADCRLIPLLLTNQEPPAVRLLYSCKYGIFTSNLFTKLDVIVEACK